MSEGESATRVAIACQGGGSHTAYAAGVPRGLLREWDDQFQLVGIRGTSGGAFNALAAWYGLITAGEERAVDLLAALGEDLAADGERIVYDTCWRPPGDTWRRSGDSSRGSSVPGSPS